MNKIAGPVERVVVVGAGIAGLAAASRLRQAGIDAVVLEARDRIGGRPHTVDLAGTPVDMGGSWIHHPIGNPLTAFCDDHGIARDAGNPLPSLSAFDMAERRRLDHAEVEFYAQTETDAFWDSTEALSQRLGPGASAHDAIETYVAECGLSPTVARRLRQELRAELEANAADSAENQSLRWISLAEVFEGELFGDLPRDGYRSVVKQLATGLDIRLGVEVVSVEVDADGIRAACADGSVEAGSHAIVAVPLGVLKKGSPKFDPPLPAPMLRAVDALGFGRYEKIVLAFESAFWRDDGISHLIVFPSDEGEPSMWVFDLDAFAAGPVLCAHLFHTITPYALDRPPAQAVDWLRASLAEVFGRPVPEPVATAVTSWTTDPYTRGAYTQCPPGADPSMFDALGEPAHGRLLFAGEHTSSARSGYADGAYASGLRAGQLLTSGGNSTE
jgi:polyamine oxidase